MRKQREVESGTVQTRVLFYLYLENTYTMTLKWINDNRNRQKKGNVSRRDLKKEGKNKRRLQSVLVLERSAECHRCRSNRNWSDQLLEESDFCNLVKLPAVSQIRNPSLPHQSPESSRRVRLATHSSSYHPAQELHQIRGSQVLVHSPNHTGMPQELAHILRDLLRQTCGRLRVVPALAAPRLLAVLVA